MYWRTFAEPDQIYWSRTEGFHPDVVFGSVEQLAHHAGITGPVLDKIDIVTNPRVKVAVVTQSYHRTDGSSRRHLDAMFRMLEAQTYQDFKVFVVGDNYQPEEEFRSVCATYHNEIYVANNAHSCRELKLGHRANYWASGGVYAARAAYTKAKEEEYDIALMLDDDDYWKPGHVELAVKTMIEFPHAALAMTKSRYRSKGVVLPRTTKVKCVSLNNYLPGAGDGVRSASIHNLHLLYEDTSAVWDRLAGAICRLHVAEDKGEKLYPGDAALLELINGNCAAGKYGCILIPTITVIKESDGNWHTIGLDEPR